MFYLTTHSTHFIYGYMASDIWLRTILIVRKETRCCHIGYSYRLTARVLLYAPSHRQDNTNHGLCYTSRGALAGTSALLNKAFPSSLLTMVEHPFVVRWVVGLIPRGGTTELFLIPASAPRLVQQRLWYVLSCLWDGAYKRTLAANRKECPMWQQRVSPPAI